MSRELSGDKLSSAHRRMLEDESSISTDVIEARGYETVTTKAALKELGFSDYQARTPALLIPVRDSSGEIVTYQARPDKPRIKKGKPIKYETPSGSRMRLDFPPTTRHMLRDPSKQLWITEGIKKADAIASRGRCVVGQLGVWNWKGTNASGGKTALPDWEDVALNGRQVFIVFDSDVMQKEAVHTALDRLSGWLKNRGAIVRFVYLPTDDANKTGIDDYLAAGHSIEDVEALSATMLRAAPKPEGARDVGWGPYVLEDGRISHRRGTRDGDVVVPLCNFDARIAVDETIDDGAEISHSFVIEGKIASGPPLPTITVSADRFNSMTWTTKEWGLRAVVAAGHTNRDHLRAAIQMKSMDAEQRTTFGHTGWREFPDGRWGFLTSSGAITTDGLDESVLVNPGDGLGAYHLPTLDRLDRLNVRKDALRASLNLLTLAPHRIMAPLLASVYRATLGNLDFSVNLYGPSGEGKTQLAILAVQHFGESIAEEDLLGWSSTANALEESLFRLKDCVAVIDDFAPQSDEYQMRRQRATVERTLRTAANSSARRRSRPDGTVKPPRPPRALVLMTGEDSLPGFSVNARVLTLEVEPGMIRPLDRLTPHQEAAKEGKYALAMTAWVQHLALDYPRIRDQFERDWKTERNNLSATHGRIASTTAQLLVAARMLIEFAEEAGAISCTEAGKYHASFRQGILAAMRSQADHLAAADPVEDFLDLLAALFDSGRAHLEHVDGGAPSDPGRHGWINGTPQGPRIGWMKDGDACLEPQATYAAVQHFRKEQGGSIPITKGTLWKRLTEAGTIIADDGHNTMRVTISGQGRRRLLVFPGGIPDRSGPNGPRGTDADQDDMHPRTDSESGPVQRTDTPEESVLTPALSQTQRKAPGPIGPVPEGTPSTENHASTAPANGCADIDDFVAHVKAGKFASVPGFKHDGTHTPNLKPYVERCAEGGVLRDVAPAILDKNPDIAAKYWCRQ